MTKITDLGHDEMAAIVGSHCACGKGAAGVAIKVLFAAIAQKVADGSRVKLPELGTIERIAYQGGPGHNPRTGEKITIPPGFRAKLNPSKAMKDRLAASSRPAQQAAQ